MEKIDKMDKITIAERKLAGLCTICGKEYTPIPVAGCENRVSAIRLAVYNKKCLHYITWMKENND